MNGRNRNRKTINKTKFKKNRTNKNSAGLGKEKQVTERRKRGLSALCGEYDQQKKVKKK